MLFTVFGKDRVASQAEAECHVGGNWKTGSELIWLRIELVKLLLRVHLK